MDHKELHDALAWLRQTVSIAQAALRGTPPPHERIEWEDELAHKQSLLLRLEKINEKLLCQQQQAFNDG